MAEHTPGPWSRWVGSTTAIHAGPVVLAEVTSCNKLDARLIAAAPELLAAARDVLPMVEAAAPNHDECDSEFDTLCADRDCQDNGCMYERLRLLRAAIAKAEGR